MPGNTIIDLAGLTRRVSGDMALLDEITSLFLSRYPEAMRQIREALTSHSSGDLEKAAYRLRGYLVNLHAKRSSSIVLELELRARRNDCADSEKIYAKLEKQLVLVVKALEGSAQRAKQGGI